MVNHFYLKVWNGKQLLAAFWKDLSMHPIINSFLNTNEGLTLILEKNYDKNQFLECVFNKMLQMLNLQHIDKLMYSEIDEAVIKGHPDSRVHFLFITVSISFTCRRKEFARSNAILSIGESLMDMAFEPTLISYFTMSIASLKYMENKSLECNQMLKKALSLVDKKSPRFHTILINAANYVASVGKLKDLGPEELSILDSPTSEQHILVSKQAQLINAIFTCSYKDGKSYFEQYSKVFTSDATFLESGHKELLKIISGDFNEKNYQDKFFKMYVNILSLLISGNILEAQKIYQQFSNMDWTNNITIPFERYLGLHIELGLKNIGKARLLYHEMIDKNGPIYIDDFFLTRIQLLEKNQEEGLESFSRLIENINRYSAIGRLSFELQFAAELKSTDILYLMNNINQKISTSSKVKKLGITNKTAKGVDTLIGNGTSMLQVKKLVKKFANINDPVLITGETGTGKELIAKAIHEEGPNSKEPFLAINCGSLTDSLLQSELFGYEAGAFTGAQKERKGIFEAAGKGTVFLDEFGDINPSLQVSLLRVLESNEIRSVGGTTTRKVECKIVIAANNDLQLAVEEKKFRKDLYFRLARFDIKLPPLRERIEDIPLLIDYFLNRDRGKNEKLVKVSNELLDSLTKYRWPGNIRELKNETERLKILHAEKEILGIEDFDIEHLWGVKKKPTFQKMDEITSQAEQDILPASFQNDTQIEMIIGKGNKIEQRHKKIIEIFYKYKKLTRSQIVQILSISAGTATSDLKTLCEQKVISRVSPSKSKKSDYFILVEKKD